ncbi:MAG: spore coat protein [Candidatus Pacebacteria bacterium CG_4_10_14_3_um_filter_34_15]|nr:NTP transferase domain-containing protein [Candidatus Pacearchaeota archaeon]NCQ65612.1 NTP transferase domain-containing protein [Candidatus Paceibacterota bacterium]OIO44907.1 MAG: spore coat protein [Candidatus Pacebacteria bacterium CG1_02_43_31]PIQ80536.1 MAG: spore coat protein [Candidatus Pacebacteria bacterium CG11_big_fil_rev_8_21_14_0_20_34_55]PIX81582.1 MAG: spore coat protein [Candidatus Pacebacteria bacterium CG_4_10_14_3_um_filter_34_15]PJC44171.1 MAG: spore coat protein [Cand
MKGIILAGGSGSRLRPLTKVTSKQLLPVYDQPMIYYPLKTLLDGGIRDILIIVAPDHAGDFLKLLGSGKDFGCKFTYEIQDKPEGIAQAFIVGQNFIGNDSATLILGDNIYEDTFKDEIASFKTGARIFIKDVKDPQRFGVVEFDENNRATSIEEKPKTPKSKYAVTGMYIYDNTVIEKVKKLQSSDRGELEITDLNNLYLEEQSLDVAFVDGRWFDTGTFESLHEAIIFVRNRELAKKKIK